MTGDNDSPDEVTQEVSQDLLKQLLAAHEKKKAYSRKYMQGKRSEDKDGINEYKRQWYRNKKKLEKQEDAATI